MDTGKAFFFGLAILGLITITLSYAAEGKTGATQQLIEDCDSKGAANVYCVGFVSGVGGALIANDDVHRAWRMCITGFVSNGQMIQAFLNYAKANPKTWQEPAHFTVIRALSQTWP